MVNIYLVGRYCTRTPIKTGKARVSCARVTRVTARAGYTKTSKIETTKPR